MKKLLTAIIIAGLLIISVVTVSRALFQDTEYVTGNKVLGASINLMVGENDPSTVSFAFSHVQPGEEREFSVPIVNSGRMTGNFWMEVQAVNSTEGENPESETDTTGEGELDDCAEVWLGFTNIENPALTAQSLDWTVINTISPVETFWGNSVDAWINARIAQFTLKLRNDNCGPEAMGDGFDLDLIFHLDQVELS